MMIFLKTNPAIALLDMNPNVLKARTWIDVSTFTAAVLTIASEWKKKNDVAHAYNGTLFSRKNEGILTQATIQIRPEDMLSEICQ